MINIIAYIIYLSASIFITVYVGWILYSNGRDYILSIFGEPQITDFINKVLLTGYYLLNIGLVLYKVSVWEDCVSSTLLVENVLNNIANVMLLLTTLHYLNILLVALFKKELQDFFNHV